MKSGKYTNSQMSLFEEWERSQKYVFSARSDLVRREWLSGCKDERALIHLGLIIEKTAQYERRSVRGKAKIGITPNFVSYSISLFLSLK